MLRRRRRSAGNLHGLNGWVTLFAVDVIATPPVWTWNAIQMVKWRLTSAADLPTLAPTVVISVVQIAASVYVAVLFFRKDRRFPRAWIALDVSVICYDSLWSPAESTPFASAVNLMILVIGTLYLLRSKRVAKTFLTSAQTGKAQEMPEAVASYPIRATGAFGLSRG